MPGDAPTSLERTIRRPIAVIVLGMHRSGTSALARLLSINGAALPAKVMAPQPDNPAGFWEPTDVVALSDRLLEALDSSWDDVFSGAEQRYLSNVEGALFDEAVETIRTNYADAGLIVLKDPRISVLNDFWRRVLTAAGYDVRYVIMVRNPLEVAASLTARNGFSREKSLLLWASHMVAAERDTRGQIRAFTTYDGVMSDWRKVVRTLEERLDITLPRRTPASSLESDRFIKSSLRHHESVGPLAREGVWPALTRLYAWLLAAAEGHEPPIVDFEEAEAELNQFRDLLGPILAEVSLDLKIAQRDIGQLRQDLVAAQGGADHARTTLGERLAEASKAEGRLHDEIAARQAHLESVEARLEMREAELAEAVAGQARLREEASAHLAAIEAGHADAITQSHASIDSLRAELADRERDLAAREEALAQARGQLLNLQNEIDVRQTHLTALEAAQVEAASKSDATIAELKRQLDDAFVDHARLQAEADIRQKYVWSLEAEHRILETEHKTLEAEHKKLEDEYTKLCEALNARDEEAKDQILAHQRLSAELQVRQAHLEAVEAQHADERVAALEDAAALDEALRARGAQLEHLGAENARLRGELDARETHLAALGQLNGDLLTEAEQLARAKDELAGQLDQLQVRHEEASGRLAEMSGQNAQLNERFAASRVELEDVRAALTASEALSQARASELDVLKALAQSEQDHRQRLEHTVRAANEMARLQHETLEARLRIETAAAARAEALQLQTQQQFEALQNSTAWRLTGPLRAVLSRTPSARANLRRLVKAVYWTLTAQWPARLRARRQFVATAALLRQVPAQYEDAVSGPEYANDKAMGTEGPADSPILPEESARPFEPIGQVQYAAWPGAHSWPMAGGGPDSRVGLELYDIRPDDSVPVEARRGARFMHRFGLEHANSAFASAVDYLNTKPRHSLVAAEDPNKPAVSIIVPVYGQLAYTLNCLDSLIDHRSRHRFEIILADDQSPDDTGLHGPNLSGVRYLRQPTNLGFIRNCNAAAAIARGQWVVMLNNDTRVVEGWLDELIGSFDLFPKAGLVGSKLFYPDGLLQEAGGVVWRDGSAWNYGRNDDPNRPQYCYARQVDYVSGAAIALPMALWRSLAGFDETFVPAYCEDSDLAFRVRRAGGEVWMQPTSRVIHYEGRTSGTDLNQGVKAYQVTNQQTLQARWGPTLAAHRPNGETILRERERSVEKRVLVIDATAPTPDQDAGSVTTVKVIEVFQAMGYKVTYVPISNWLYQPRYIDPLMRRGVECLYAPFNLSLDDFLAEQGELFDVIHVFRFQVLRDVLPIVRRRASHAKLVFNNMDLHYLRTERQAEIEGSEVLRQEARSLKAVELKTMNKADIVCVPSTLEKQLLDLETSLKRPVVVMPFMVDLPPPQPGYGGARRNVLFLGGYGHTPNVDAAVWMAREIWPLLRNKLPNARLILAGANPTAEVRGLAAADIEVPGRVDDLEPLFQSAAVFVAPLRYGAGVKGKLYTAFGFGVPVVTTSIGAEGMDLTPNREVSVADDPQGFADAVLSLWTQRSFWEQTVEAAHAFLANRHTVLAGVSVFEDIL